MTQLDHLGMSWEKEALPRKRGVEDQCRQDEKGGNERSAARRASYRVAGRASRGR